MGIVKRTFNNIFFFFPFQLLFIHFKRNQLLLLFWVILFGYITNTLGDSFGMPSLFLAPEYLDNVDHWAFLIYGFIVGGFIVAFNISSYVVNAHYFPFIATLSRPFIKYALNNFIIPLVFIVTFVNHTIDFQLNHEFLDIQVIIYNILAFVAGVTLNIFLAFTYFFSTNKDIFRMFGVSSEKIGQKVIVKPLRKIIEKDTEWKKKQTPKDNAGTWRVETYMSTPFKVRLARSFTHYTSDMIHKVLLQNHINAAFFAVLMIGIIGVLGVFMDNPYFVIPAGASVILLFTILIMMYAAIHTLMKEWSFTFIILLFVFINFTSRYSYLTYQNSAYGMNYGKKGVIELDSLKYYDPVTYEKDYQATVKILEKWKAKNYNKKSKKLPKMVLINTSGGGLKAAIWTYYSLAYADSALGGELMNHAQLMTGASGGMVGASYFRELYLQKTNGELSTYYNDTLLSNFSKDLLNPITFSFFVKDWSFKYQQFDYNGYSYYKDRAYAYENKLNKNTCSILDKPLKAYKKPEADAKIPMIIMTPTIINDGSQLLISPQDISYLLSNRKVTAGKDGKHMANLEFRKAYRDYGADDIRYTSVLRMNSTFPYVSPIVSLPGSPRLNIMDAGFRDNYGLPNSLRFYYSFYDWIKENTSGVIFLQIAEESNRESIEAKNKSMFSQFLRPLGNVYSNLFSVQKINNEQLIEISEKIEHSNIEFVNLYLQSKEEKISLSWHLTKREKKRIIESINSSNNQEAINVLEKALAD